MSTSITHVIFDFDGTIVNTIDVFLEVLTEYALSHGKQLSPEFKEYIPNMTSFTIMCNKLIDLIGLSEDTNLTELGTYLARQVWAKEFKFITGVDRLIQHLHKNNIPIAIATGNSKRHFNTVSKKFANYFEDGIYFSHTVCGWDDIEVVNKKPHPDVYHVCAKRFQSPPNDINNVLIFEDSITGIEGAVASGMKTVWIKDERLRNLDYNNNEISYTIDSFDDFKPEIFGLPSFTN